MTPSTPSGGDSQYDRMLSGQLTGSANLLVTSVGATSGTNTVTLSNSTNNYSGAITVTGGSLAMLGAASLAVLRRKRR